ncbi:2-dehydro-3-deoxygalactonokinase [Celeribacter persicus]|uniref:2-dehydro-3-deoxygalactonokinase n=1 Tax=Celeribacter persicus TaxID=1651082 RepID=A0A2T5HP31_9RHOB|nr:2-dehydro-3-deoxygalactonokinase [Celeribacter persicus]PTQ73316.1 2-dehydro-3-deoxygalactonokinase [Celeribacter persicus]
MSATAGILNGTKLRLWDLDTSSPVPTVTELTDRTSLAMIAGTQVPARSLPCSALPETLPFPDIPPLVQDHPRTLTRGEEVTMAGFIAENPKFDGILCLPSETSTLWAHVSAEEIVSMRRFLTGTMVGAVFGTPGLGEAEAFTDTLSDCMSRPENVALRLSTLKTELDLGALPLPEATSRATAALIGAEMAATRAYWLGQPVALIGADPLRAPYRAALDSQFVPVTEAEGDAMTLTGFRLARERRTA